MIFLCSFKTETFWKDKCSCHHPYLWITAFRLLNYHKYFMIIFLQPIVTFYQTMLGCKVVRDLVHFPLSQQRIQLVIYNKMYSCSSLLWRLIIPSVTAVSTWFLVRSFLTVVHHRRSSKERSRVEVEETREEVEDSLAFYHNSLCYNSHNWGLRRTKSMSLEESTLSGVSLEQHLIILTSIHWGAGSQSRQGTKCT